MKGPYSDEEWERVARLVRDAAEGDPGELEEHKYLLPCCDWGYGCREPVVAYTFGFERRPFCERHAAWHEGCMTGRGIQGGGA